MKVLGKLSARESLPPCETVALRCAFVFVYAPNLLFRALCLRRDCFVFVAKAAVDTSVLVWFAPVGRCAFFCYEPDKCNE